MNIIPNTIFTSTLDTRDYAIKILMDSVYKNSRSSLTSSDIPTNLIAIRHPDYKELEWFIFNINKKMMYQINTKTCTILKLNYNDIILQYKLNI